MRRVVVPIAVLLAVFLAPAAAPAQENGDRDVVVVKMIEKSATSYAFSPSEVTVERGQTLRFVQEGQVPHNVEFKDPPDESRLDGIRMGPFLMGRGETYEIRIDERFSEGTYDYICTPHVTMGMTGKIVVRAFGSNRD